MGYYNYHGMIKRRIRGGEQFSVVIDEKYKDISPAMIIIFCDRAYPIREYRFEEYFSIFNELGISVKDNRLNN